MTVIFLMMTFIYCRQKKKLNDNSERMDIIVLTILYLTSYAILSSENL